MQLNIRYLSNKPYKSLRRGSAHCALIPSMYNYVFTIVESLSPLLHINCYPKICKSMYIRPHTASTKLLRWWVAKPCSSLSISFLLPSIFIILLVFKRYHVLFFASYLSLSFLEQILCSLQGQYVWSSSMPL